MCRPGGLSSLLVPFGIRLEDLPMAIGPAIHERVQEGKIARLQIELGEAEETERKFTQRLESYLASIGFEDGSLEARIGAYGWSIDGARQRERLRAEAPSRAELTATRDRLEAHLSAPPPDGAGAGRRPGHVRRTAHRRAPQPT